MFGCLFCRCSCIDYGLLVSDYVVSDNYNVYVLDDMIVFDGYWSGI